ncbi:MAG: CofH family radical SAM protein [Selenomonadaceae bacterium]|nr:CofH family radical SAM protein [Selenomonadaceae bacterium]
MKNILQTARKKAENLERINFDEALALYKENDLLLLGRTARKIKESKSGKKIFYIVNRHINLTNICSSNCPLCAFQCQSGDNRGYTLELDEIDNILQDFSKVENLSEIHVVSAIHPEKNFSYYLDVIKKIKNFFPSVSINAFTPAEIFNFAKTEKKSFAEILTTLKNFGVDTLPGGGAEIFSPRVREIICPKKLSGGDWLEIMETAHKIGMKTNASILYGHVETVEERIEHLIKLRELQDKTNGFQAMLLFPFFPKNTELGEKFNIRQVGAWENLKMLALSRIVLDNFDHFKAFWVMLTLPVAQLALSFGADDLDGTIGEEKIIHAAGAKGDSVMTVGTLREIISEVGYIPTMRNSFYN